MNDDVKPFVNSWTADLFAGPQMNWTIENDTALITIKAVNPSQEGIDALKAKISEVLAVVSSKGDENK